MQKIAAQVGRNKKIRESPKLKTFQKYCNVFVLEAKRAQQVGSCAKTLAQRQIDNLKNFIGSCR